VPGLSVVRNVSNPAQNSSRGPVILNLPEMRNARRSSIPPDRVPCRGRVPRAIGRKSEGELPKTASFHHRLAREAAGDTETAGSGNPIAKDVPLLRLDHITLQDMLPGMRQVSQTSLKFRR
jgi:hypothetical protein